MDTSQIFITIAIVTLAVIAVLFFVIRKGKAKRLTPLTGLAFGFMLAGIIFSEDRLIGYGLMGVGVVLAVVDIFLQAKKKTKE
jgi:hypothetical protein